MKRLFWAVERGVLRVLSSGGDKLHGIFNRTHPILSPSSLYSIPLNTGWPFESRPFKKKFLPKTGESERKTSSSEKTEQPFIRRPSSPDSRCLSASFPCCQKPKLFVRNPISGRFCDFFLRKIAVLFKSEEALSLFCSFKRYCRQP